MLSDLFNHQFMKYNDLISKHFHDVNFSCCTSLNMYTKINSLKTIICHLWFFFSSERSWRTENILRVFFVSFFSKQRSRKKGSISQALWLTFLSFCGGAATTSRNATGHLLEVNLIVTVLIKCHKQSWKTKSGVSSTPPAEVHLRAFLL